MATIAASDRVTSSSLSHHNNQNEEEVDVKKEDENDDNNEYQNNNNNISFFDDWKKGNWCWERDYNKYPVVHSFPNNDDDIKVEEENNEENINDINGFNDNDDDDNDNGTYSINDRTRDDLKNPPSNNNDDDDDDDDDDSFYDDWVEGNWCLLDNDGNNKNDNNNDRAKRLRIKTQKNRGINDESEFTRKRKCSSDDGKEDKDGDEDWDDDEEFLQGDNNNVHNHRDDKRSAIKKLRRRTYTIHHNQLWMEMFQKLVEYKKQHKNTMVPHKYDKDPKLGHWVSQQRCHYKRDELPPKRLTLLNSIDFDLEVRSAEIYQTLWMDMFKKLTEHKKQRKNTRVLTKSNEDPKLGKWVCTQRQECKKGRLLPKRLALLNSIGFFAVTYQTLWMEMFQKLVAYKKRHKNTMVLQQYNEDPKLGRWVSNQRHKKDKLLPKRLALLNSIDFTWNGK